MEKENKAGDNGSHGTQQNKIAILAFQFRHVFEIQPVYTNQQSRQVQLIVWRFM